jgi:tetratricopeptide (TPR) repeat protein
MGIGIAYDELGKPQTALSYIRKAIKLSPAVPEYWSMLGDMYIKLNRFDEGIPAYKKAIEMNPDDPDVWLDLSVAYADARLYQEAYDVLLEGLKYHDENPDFFFGMAYYLFLLGRNKHANETLSKALNMDFNGYKRLFIMFPEAQHHPAVVEIIEAHKK